MRIEKLSNDFTPRHKGLLFGIDTERYTPSDILVEVMDMATNEVVATQQLRSIISAEVNIAPYVKLLAESSPSLSLHTAFREIPTASYAIRVGELLSEPVRVSVNRTSLYSPSLITTSSRNRHIAYGEKDELLIAAIPQGVLTANILSDRGETLTLEATAAMGIAALVLSTEDFSAETNSLDVELLYNGVAFDKLHYTLLAPRRGAVRLAWISSKGSVEYYTFPVVAKRELKSEKKSIDSYSGRQVVRSVSESILSLFSRYEPRITIEALAEIVASPKVWIVGKEEYQAVEVLSAEVERNLFGEPDLVALSIAEWRREESVL